MPILSDAIVEARLLDSDNQLLSIGEARILTSQGRGVFWPRKPVNEDLILKTAAIVEMSEGHSIRFQKISLCPSQGTRPHFDFDLNG
jgi:hypothetical protein